MSVSTCGRLDALHEYSLMRDNIRNGVIAIVQMPPPVTGLSNVNSAVVGRFEDRGIIHSVINMAAPSVGSRLWILSVRFARACLAALAVIKSRHQAKTIYMPLDSKAGIFLNFALLIIARLARYDIYLHHHNFSYIDRKSRAVSVLTKVATGSCHIFLCDRMAGAFTSLYGQAFKDGHQSYLVLPNSFMIEDSATGPKLPGRFTIGHLSNLSVEKGSVEFVEIFRNLKRAGDDVRGVIAGPIGDEPTRLAVTKAVADYPKDFTWVGPKHGDEKAAFYREVDVFVFPSRYVNEAQPLVLLEALAGGAAILATPRGCCACDHEDTPGKIIAEDRFREEAVDWIANLPRSADDRMRLRRSAMEAGRSKRREAAGKFLAFLDRLEAAP